MQRFVFCANAAAEEYGVCPQMPLSAAFALNPDLTIYRRDEQAEQSCLRTLAQWAGRFTSMVSLEPPQALLLEVKSSLRLFDGIDNLFRLVSEGIQTLRYDAILAVAPTPLAALWLARAGSGSIVTETRRLPGVLGRLPLTVTGWNEKTLELLAGMGLDCLGDVMRLPRDGLTRRIGRHCVPQLDRALGRLPDPRQMDEPPLRFETSLELPAETTDTTILLNAAEQLIERLAQFLLCHQAGVQRLWFRLYHPDLPASRVTIGLFTASRNKTRFLSLLKERFERVTLQAPIIALRLETEDALSLGQANRGLFETRASMKRGNERTGELIERLRARLGVDSVCGFCLVPEHRPEATWYETREAQQVMKKSSHATVSLSESSAEFFFAPRPLWLLSEPYRLKVIDDRPVFEGRLEFENGPERIESGWWDDGGIARDYYVARDHAHARFWIYRECRQHKHWFLHGIFG